MVYILFPSEDQGSSVDDKSLRVSRRTRTVETPEPRGSLLVEKFELDH